MSFIEIKNKLAKEMFFTEFYRFEPTNVEYKRFKQALESNRISTKVLKDIKLSSFMETLSSDSLFFSNNTICDLVAQIVFSYTSNMKLKRILGSLYIGYVEMEKNLPKPKIYPSFYDGSRLVIIDSQTAYYLDQVNELIVLKVLGRCGYYNHFDVDFEKILFDKWFYKNKNPYSVECLEEYEDFLKRYGGQELLNKLAELYGEITQVSLGFIIGHEVGHVYLGHTQYSEDINENHQMEIGADEVAVLFINDYLRYYNEHQQHVEFQLCGICSAIITMALLSSKSPFDSSETHPSIRARYVCVIFNIQRLFGKEFAKKITEHIRWICEESNFYMGEQNWWSIPAEMFGKIESELPELIANAKYL